MQGEETEQKNIAALRQAIIDNRPIETTILNYRKDGSTFFNRLILTPVKIDGVVTHYIGFQQDVTHNDKQNYTCKKPNKKPKNLPA